jgi:molecular chaperone GrpE (heat shock protein)
MDEKRKAELRGLCNNKLFDIIDRLTAELAAAEQRAKEYEAHATNAQQVLTKDAAQLAASERRAKAAADALNGVDELLKAIDEATGYVARGTGIWHTIGKARQTIRKWRGVQEKEEAK